MRPARSARSRRCGGDRADGIFAPAPAAGEEATSSTAAGAGCRARARRVRRRVRRGSTRLRARELHGAARRRLTREVDSLFEPDDVRPRTRPIADAAARRAHAPATLDEFVGQEHLLGEGSRAAHGDRAGPPALDDPVRAARGREDDAGADHGRRRDAAFEELSAVEAGRAEVRAVIERAAAPPPDWRRADDLLPRRDPPLQQGPAGRAAAGGRGGPRDADRRDDREPVVRGQRRAALAMPGLRAARGAEPADVVIVLRARSTRRVRRAADDDALELLAARAGGDARTALAALELACGHATAG